MCNICIFLVERERENIWNWGERKNSWNSAPLQKPSRASLLQITHTYNNSPLLLSLVDSLIHYLGIKIVWVSVLGNFSRSFNCVYIKFKLNGNFNLSTPRVVIAIQFAFDCLILSNFRIVTEGIIFIFRIGNFCSRMCILI